MAEWRKDATESMTAGPGRALVLLHDMALRQEIATALAHAGLVVTEVNSFHAAARVIAEPLDVLVTDVRLGEYNGLHLVLRARSYWPNLAAVVIATSLDEMLQREAEDLGATFVVLPVSAHELMVAVLRTMTPGGPARGGRPVRAPFERRRIERRQTTRAVAAEVDRRLQRRRSTDRPERSGTIES